MPKAGGAIRGIGEKFSVNPVTGTGSLHVPLPASPGRSEHVPELALSYDSGSGNGPFGFGWSLSLPSITRKTDKGLPRYQDGEESDVFLLSGAEDLVPVLDAAGDRVELTRTVHGVRYSIRLYRPRIEGLFARIERWTEMSTGISHWRTVTRDNITTLFGLDDGSRVHDPDDPRRVFSYLMALTLDGMGNVTRFDHVAENGDGVDLAAAHEANRTDRTAQRYLKRVRYGNVEPYFADWSAAPEAKASLPARWLFQVVLDYGDHDAENPTPAPDRPWAVRPDPFSTFRPGFEVRTYRRCQRVLLFHDFPEEAGVGADCLVRSADFVYSDQRSPADPTNPIYTLLDSVTQVGYRRTAAGYDRRAMPPLEMEYSQPEIHPEVLTLTDPESLENLPEGLDSMRFRWVDLDAEGASGILTEQDGGWAYKRNLSPVNEVVLANVERVARARFGPQERVASLPSGVRLDRERLMDLTGAGRLGLVTLDDPAPGFFERTADGGWEPMATLRQLPKVDWSAPNLQFVDVTGDGLADVLVTDDDEYTYYPSLGADGFGPSERTVPPSDGEHGARVVLTMDDTQLVSLADMTGDGLHDLVRVRNGEVCYWPNQGYGRFGARVTMDAAPRFTDGERFDPRRVRLADVDGSGTTDLLYVGEDGVHVCFNRSGNTWSEPQRLAVFPGADDLRSVQALDLLGNGTACVVWSSPLPGDAAAPLRYVDLMGSRKPHLLVRVRNNLGAETGLSYAPSTRFYLQDRLAGRPWVTRLPFPVQVVDRVETYDWIGRTRHVTRSAYHHGYFDGVEREFRGFGMVEQWDTEEHRHDTLFPDVETVNEDAASFSPPVVTRTWFHTGAFLEASAVSRHYAHEYWVEPALRGDVAAIEAMRVPDSVLEPACLTAEETREAFRALKGSILRVEVYAEDGSPLAGNPYTVTEHSYTVRRVQPFGPNQHAVFLTHSREEATFHYERQPDDPRVTYDLTLEVDEFGNPRRSVSVAYPRRPGGPDPEPDLTAAFQAMLAHDQSRLHVGATEHVYTTPLNRPEDAVPFDAYRAPLPCEAITAELTGFCAAGPLFRFAEIEERYTALWDGSHDIPYEDVSTPDIEGTGVPTAFARRIVERSRTLYRRDDLRGLLPFRGLESLALPGESYRLALTPGLVSRVFGTRVDDSMLVEGGYVQLDGQEGWWVPSGRVFFSAGDADAPAQELAEARGHFYRQRRAVDPFGGIELRDYDTYDLLPTSATDPVGNVTTADNDYRVLHPFRTTDPNGSRSEAAFDCLGLVSATAVSGKAGEGDSLAGIAPDVTDAEIQAVRADPLAGPAALLGGATSRIVTDLLAYFRTRDQTAPAPPMVYTLARETHVSDLAPGQKTRFHHAFLYGDGMGREAQHKAQAEAGPVPGVSASVSPRWVASGWTVYNNKGKPVRKYEPFFTATQLFEFNRLAGVSSVLLYDPLQRVVATLHPDSTFDKTVFDAWRQETWDANDTVLIADPRTDADVGDAFGRLLGTAPFTSWHDQRSSGRLGATPEERAANQDAAQKAAAHAATPAVAHLDSLGRTCLSVADNGLAGGVAQRYPIRTAMDTENKPLALFDALGRHVMETCVREPVVGGSGFRFVTGYDLVGRPLYRSGMDGGERRTLNDVAGYPIRRWDARGQTFRILYDALRRATHRFVAVDGVGRETLLERLLYGERHPDATRNLRGRLFRHYDGAGVASHDRYDFRGHLVQSGRQLAVSYSASPDWSVVAAVSDQPALDVAAVDAAAAPLLVAGDAFTSFSRFDALDRPVQTVTPHVAGRRPSVIQPGYNEANLLERIDVWVRQTVPPLGLLDPATADVPAVGNVDYDAHGRRLQVDVSNGTSTTYTYDPLTFRLTTLTTVRPNPDANARTVQALTYAYDPVGNLTRLRDAADTHNVVFFRNQRVEPSADYMYDAIYRLVSATGREHLGQTGGVLNAPQQVTNDDRPRQLAVAVGDGDAMANYTERYAYDPVGNLLSMVHYVATGAWTRRYAYTEPSLVAAGEVSNRLSATSLPGDSDSGPFSAVYQHDKHGNLARMPHLPVMSWDAMDRLQATSRQVVSSGTPETTYYTYDASGERVRKVTDRQARADQAATRKTERLYFGAIELHREYDGTGTLTLERESLHVILGDRRALMIETRTLDVRDADQAPAELRRYQYNNHLGSATLELDDRAAVISYEEYFPYGSSSYQAVRSQTDSPKRYRHTGKERDEENDLYYHGARYYAPWLCRWTSCDPAGHVDGLNRYAYVRANPQRFTDVAGTDSNDETHGPWPKPGQQTATVTTPDPDNPGESKSWPPSVRDFDAPSTPSANQSQSTGQAKLLSPPWGGRTYRLIDLELTLIGSGAGGVRGRVPGMLPAGGLGTQFSLRFPITEALTVGAYASAGPGFQSGVPGTQGAGEGITLQAKADAGTGKRWSVGVFGQFGANETTASVPKSLPSVPVSGGATGIIQYQSSASNPVHQLVLNPLLSGGSAGSLLSTQPIGRYFTAGGMLGYTLRERYVFEAGHFHTWATRPTETATVSNHELRLMAGVGLAGHTSEDQAARYGQSVAYSGMVNAFVGLPGGAASSSRDIAAWGLLVTLDVGLRIPLFKPSPATP